MRQDGASIICLPVPIGAMSVPDYRLQVNNPISLTGRLVPGVAEQLQGDARADIGDYCRDGYTASTIGTLRGIHGRISGGAESATPGPSISDTQQPPLITGTIGGGDWSDQINKLWKFDQMNHEADHATQNTFETTSSIINTLCFHT